MNIPTSVKFTKEHEWISLEGNIATVGVTDFAQSELGDIVFIEVETIGEQLEQGDTFGTIEAVKTVSDVYMPVSGEVLEFNESLNSSPELVNKDPYGKSWIIKVKVSDPTQFAGLLDNLAYAEIIGA